MQRLRSISFDDILIVGAFAVIGLIASAARFENDTWWQLRAGQQIWATHSIPLHDTYSYTATGAAWPNHEWMWEAVIYAGYRLAGWPGASAIAGLFVVGTTYLLWKLMSVNGNRGTLVRLLFLLAVLPPLVSILAVRPNVASMFFLLLTTWLLCRKRWWVVPIVFITWAQFHGAVILGLAALVSSCCIALVFERRHLRAAIATTVVSILGITLNPLGFGLWRYAFSHTSDKHIQEWQPLNLVSYLGVTTVLLAAALVGLLIRKRFPQSWAGRVLVISSFLLLVPAIIYERLDPAFFLLGIPSLITMLPQKVITEPARSTTNTIIAIALCLTALVLASSNWMRPLVVTDWTPLSAEAISALEHCNGPIYNLYEDGGPLIWFTRNPVFIDSRLDPYTKAFLDETFASRADGSYGQWVAKYNIKCAFLPAHSPDARAMQNDHWHIAYSDSAAVVLQRPS